MRKYRFTLVLLAAGLAFSLALCAKPKKETKTMESFITNLMTQMSLEEKVGQMTQITLEVVTKEGYNRNPTQPLTLDLEKLREAIVKYKIGSIINTGGAANSVAQWQKIITTIQDVATQETGQHIPILYGIDAIHGANYTLDATLFPQSIAMAATRNRELVRQSAAITALEIRASGIPWNFNPVLDLAREPLWPRVWETFGEDPFLASQMAIEYVRGMQGDDLSAPTQAATCLKHYLGYGVPHHGQDRTPAFIPERTLRDVFLPPFTAGIQAGAPTVMVNSAEINGIPVHSDYFLLTQILKGELGLTGFIVSDWEDVKRLHFRDRVAQSPEEAVKMAVMAGIDMSMVPADYSFPQILCGLVKQGQVPMSRIDDAVRRILQVKYRLGLFANPYPNPALLKDFASPAARELNLTAAREAITLLKNQNSLLPLSRDKKVVITGPTADKLMVLNGGWTITWQGDREELYPQGKNTFLEAMVQGLGSQQVTHVPGLPLDAKTKTDLALAIGSSDCDVIVACLGENPYCETPGNISDLTMEESQLALVEELAKTGKPMVLVLFEGRPRVIQRIEKLVDAIVLGYLPGMEGGQAMADVVLGRVNPSGRLPYSYPRTPHGYTTYDHKPLEVFDSNSYHPQWPFGFGLSYTSFEYSGLQVTERARINQSIAVSVVVKNTGARAGKETVELYVTDMYGTVSRPVRQLLGFEKVYLEPGESKTVSFTLTPQQLTFFNRENQPVVEPGEFRVAVANLSRVFFLE